MLNNERNQPISGEVIKDYFGIIFRIIAVVYIQLNILKIQRNVVEVLANREPFENIFFFR